MLTDYLQLLLTLCHLSDLFKPEWLYCRLLAVLLAGISHYTLKICSEMHIF